MSLASRKSRPVLALPATREGRNLLIIYVFPMRYALISDVHANLPALEAVLEHIEAGPERGEPVDAIYHLGDLVGYAPWPKEVVALIKRKGITGVAGNYDSTVATDYEHCGCRYEDARQEELSHLSYEWTLENSNDATKDFLASLPFRIDLRPLGGHAAGPKLVLVHGAPTLNTLYWTEDRDDDFCRQMALKVEARSGDTIAFGHTHIRWHRVVDDIHFINAGSVGRPKDGNWRAGYAIVKITEDGSEVTFERVEYDLEAAMSGILGSELPDEFAYYLESGGKSLEPVGDTS